jgi:hypothetical protein
MIGGLVPVLLSAQAFIQHSIAAGAGGAAGAVMGKSVSNTLDKVMAATKDAAGDPKGWTKQVEPPYIRKEKVDAGASGRRVAVPDIVVHKTNHKSSLPVRTSGGVRASALGWDYPSFLQALRETGAVAAPSQEPPPMPAPTYELLREIQEGSARNDVVSRLGTPSARVVMPGESGGLDEIYYFQASGETLGAVRLHDGAVRAVIVNN